MRFPTRLVLLVAFAAALLTARIAEARIWTNRSGQTIEADFVRLDGANVIVLQKGKERSIPLEKLTDADQEYARTATPPESSGAGDDPFAGDSSTPSGGDDDKEGGKSGKYPLRDWRDRLGYKARARFVAVAGQDVIIEKNNGQRNNVPFHTLIESDQEYVERELKKAGTAHLTPSRSPQSNFGSGGPSGQPPPGGYGPGIGGPGLGPPLGASPPAGGYGGPSTGPPPSGPPPGYSTPPGGVGPGYVPPASSPGGPPGNFGSKPGPGYSSPPVSGPGSSSTEPGYGTPPGGYSSPPGGYSSPPSGAPPGGFGPPGDPSSPPGSSLPGSSAPGGYAPPGGYAGPPTDSPSNPNFGPPTGAPFGAPYGTPGGPGFNGPTFKEVFYCTKCNKQLPDNIKAGDRCPHCRAYLAYEQGADGQKKFASGGSLVTYFIFGGGGFTAIAVIIGVVIRVIISAARD